MSLPHSTKLLWSKLALSAVLLFSSYSLFAQRSKADSLARQIVLEKEDSNKVRMMWQMAGYMNVYNPDTALLVAQQALYLAKEIDYVEGQSRSLSAMANTFVKLGNYPRALDLNLQKLQLEEKRDMPRNLSSVLINIGIVYVLQEEYEKALEYYSKADSVTKLHDVEDMKYYIAFNLGDIYHRLQKPDSSFRYFDQSLLIAEKTGDADLIGSSLTGLGHSYTKLKQFPQALTSYQNAIRNLVTTDDDEMLCETTLGIADLYRQLSKPDSAIYFANESFRIAKKDGFLSHQLEAVTFLAEQYKVMANVDSAFVYLKAVQQVNDSVNSKDRIRESQILASNEQLRQMEIAEAKRIAEKERSQQLQLLFIGMFIPGFFLVTLVLSKINIPIRVIKVLGVLSLLFLFEYLTLWLHPTVVELTHHTPVYEILIFVAIAAILIPAHHRIEHWLIEKLLRNRKEEKKPDFAFKIAKLKIKNPSPGQ